MNVSKCQMINYKYSICFVFSMIHIRNFLGTDLTNEERADMCQTENNFSFFFIQLFFERDVI